MPNRPERFEQYKITWENVKFIKGCGHGVQFHYGQRMSDRDEGVIGFIDGFGWYHGNTNNVEVLVLDRTSDKWESITQEDPEDIISQLKIAVKKVLKEKDKVMSVGVGKNVISNIFALVNG
jgi:hypothetical protein